ncbi:hypothetical protein KY349_04465 [Candidatus Woesearchaeota archaeon]|nr:hypothetical protein [Candidatus Woesearchaeota archaeon]
MNYYKSRARRQRSALNEYFLEADRILRYLIGNDEKLETLIICNPYKQRFMTTDQEVYHALGSIKEYDEFNLKKLSKLFEMVSIRTVARKQVLTDEMVEELRAEALKSEQNERDRSQDT